MEIPEWREAFVDTGGNGLFTYRNTYTPHESIVAQIYAKLRGNKGHSGPDALSFRILGLDTAWAVGGGRYGPKTGGQNVYFRSMNTLYPVDPDEQLAISDKSGRIVDTPVSKPDGSGSVVMSISETGKRIRGSNFIGDIGENNFVHFQTADGKALVVLTIARPGQQHPAVSGNAQDLHVGWRKHASGQP